ncbi:unnamed protein product (macronuclear) [Paramecium tetraurelia]|uniref:Uncharacterized protein n=1 Tax=Paramecium tetraurelia TaxID=5888 RepID=A0EBD1_PARTE|nr:uncharacterized protein GSPATT00025332001 [Paramecium tetraurelia]CAK92598.1 unnamed protein product [Paramecium tetraurelia]|eukprot:XP_001459995.1 hypothetical protein (macronuclear) [Paramecium tetraurelia strain d4-2]
MILKLSGGGNYENDGVKNWILGHKPAVLMCQILMLQFTNQQYSEKILYFKFEFQLVAYLQSSLGNIQMGPKLEKWIIEYTDEIIGGGYYDEQGQNIGNWVEVHENFNWYIFNQFLIHFEITFH